MIAKTMIHYALRPATIEDAVELRRVCWPIRSTEAVQEFLERTDSMSRRGRGLGAVAYNETGILGYGQLTVWPRVTEISDLFVGEYYRDQGIGTAIICYLLEKVRAWHISKVEIGVALANPRALALYRRLGFKDDRVINLDLGEGPEPVIYLTMDLDSRP